MKSLIKKLAAVLIAVATTLGFAGLGALTATADDTTNSTSNGEITVNTSRTFAGELKLYQMFTAEVESTDNTNDKEKVSYKLTEAWKTFFTSDNEKAAGTEFTETDTTEKAALSQKAVDYIQGLSETDLAAFANKAQKWASNESITPTKDSNDEADTANKATGKTTYTFTGLSLGYYLVAPADTQKGQYTVDGEYHALLVNLTDTTNNVSIQLKHEFPVIDKKITETDDNTTTDKNATDKNVGDTVTYKLSSTVAKDYKDYKKGYVFTFTDTLSKGLTLRQGTADATTDNFDPTVKIKNAGVNNADITLEKANGYYTVKVDSNTDGTTSITVEMKDIQNWKNEDGTPLNVGGKAITVEYTAQLNENAVAGSEGNNNSAQITYSNDPNSNQTGTSTPSEVKVHTFGFTIDKFTSKNENSYNESSERLGGAKFKVYADANKTTVLKFKFTAGTGNTPATAVYAKDQNATSGLTEELVTPKYGRIKVSGLKQGTYYVEETAAPEGYHKLDNMIKVTIEATYDQTTGKLSSWDIKYSENKQNATESTRKGEPPVLPVWNSNSKNLTLPSTGGWGTMLFTVVGVLVVAFGTVWYVKSGRKDSGK